MDFICRYPSREQAPKFCAERYKTACSLMEKSLELYKSHEQHHMWTIMIGGLCLGSSYTSIGDPKKGHNTPEKCDELIHKRYSEDYPLFPWILMYLGDSLRHQGSFENAKKCLEQANTLFEARYMDHHSGHGHCLARLGALYVESGNLEKATQLIDHAYQILEDNFGKIISNWDILCTGGVKKGSRVLT